jgi:capsular polysaccharide biosynthesis protein
MMSPSFVKGAIVAGGFKLEEKNVAKGFLGTLKATQVKGAELVEIKLRGPSAEEAENLINGVILNLQKTHTEMMAVSIARNKKQLQILTEDIKKAEDETELLRKKLLASHNWNAFDATLSATLLKDKTADLRAMIQQKLTLEEQLSPSRTYTTRVVDEVYISEDPVSPKKPLIIGLAILLGLFGSILIALIHNALKRDAN